MRKDVNFRGYAIRVALHFANPDISMQKEPHIHMSAAKGQ